MDENWKLVANRDSSHVELFDITADPKEQTDVQGQNPKVVERLLAKIAKWKGTLPAKPEGNIFSAERGK